MSQISVIVPVYNAEKTLWQCVDSILGQEYKDFELLLIDDGSKDASPQLCDEYAQQDDRVRVFHKENGGVSSARNLGIEHAKGAWIVFVDSDDYLSRNYLNGLPECDADLALMQYHLFKADGWHQPVEHLKTLPPRITSKDIPMILERYLTSMMFRNPTAMAFRRSLIGDIRFCEEMKVGEDSHFVHRYLERIDSIVCYYYYYYYVGVGDEAADVKYACTVDYAVRSLQYLHESFLLVERRWGISRRLFLSYIGFFKLTSKSDWQNDKAKWYGSKEVKALYDYVWPALSLKQKVRLLLARILRR